jgi:hypothetical protein
MNRLKALGLARLAADRQRRAAESDLAQLQNECAGMTNAELDAPCDIGDFTRRTLMAGYRQEIEQWIEVGAELKGMYEAVEDELSLIR